MLILICLIIRECNGSPAYASATSGSRRPCTVDSDRHSVLNTFKTDISEYFSVRTLSLVAVEETHYAQQDHQRLRELAPEGRTPALAVRGLNRVPPPSRNRSIAQRLVPTESVTKCPSLEPCASRRGRIGCTQSVFSGRSAGLAKKSVGLSSFLLLITLITVKRFAIRVSEIVQQPYGQISKKTL